MEPNSEQKRTEFTDFEDILKVLNSNNNNNGEIYLKTFFSHSLNENIYLKRFNSTYDYEYS